MAVGDAAAAAGLAVYASTQDKRLGYQNDNQRGDELANHMTNGTHPFTKITGKIARTQLPANVVGSVELADGAVVRRTIGPAAVGTAELGAKGVTDAKVADNTLTQRTMANTLTAEGTWTLEASPLRLRTPSTNHAVNVATTGVDITSTVEVDVAVGSFSRVTLKPSEVSIDATAVDVSATDVEIAGTSITVDADVAGGVVEVKGRRITLDGGGAQFEVGWLPAHSAYRVSSEGIRATTTSASANMRIDDVNGVIQRSTSSAKFKDDIQDAPAMPAILAVQPRTWLDRNRAEGDERRWFGVVAEELHALGLSHLVSYVAGEPEGVAYDRIAVALIPVVRAQHDALVALLDRVAALEAAQTPTEE